MLSAPVELVVSFFTHETASEVIVDMRTITTTVFFSDRVNNIATTFWNRQVRRKGCVQTSCDSLVV